MNQKSKCSGEVGIFAYDHRTIDREFEIQSQYILFIIEIRKRMAK